MVEYSAILLLVNHCPDQNHGPPYSAKSCSSITTLAVYVVAIRHFVCRLHTNQQCIALFFRKMGTGKLG